MSQQRSLTTAALRQWRTPLTAFAAACLLAACGGGGVSSPPTSSNNNNVYYKRHREHAAFAADAAGVVEGKNAGAV